MYLLGFVTIKGNCLAVLPPDFLFAVSETLVYPFIYTFWEHFFLVYMERLDFKYEVRWIHMKTKKVVYISGWDSVCWNTPSYWMVLEQRYNKEVTYSTVCAI